MKYNELIARFLDEIWIGAWQKTTPCLTAFRMERVVKLVPFSVIQVVNLDDTKFKGILLFSKKKEGGGERERKS